MAASVGSVAGFPEPLEPRSHGTMETLATSLPRLPVSRETLELFRATGGRKGAGRRKPQRNLYTYRGVLLFVLPVPPWSHPEFPESTDLGDKRKKNDRVRRREIKRVKT
ncbi:hypothetical protein NDU88_002680 [Pleurodeles waltl]|uniref:Uncharacterized protein n=1 Tax=Pleurodeles waltl TaxID=8319 RepID=A0AAV7NEA6_PLEWA|nr:hypothetical protein NDU88_002680 [Pleurodeles waltl]